MRIFNVLGIIFYASVLILIGLILIIFSLNIIPPEAISGLFIYVQGNFYPRIVVGLSGLLLILVSYSFAQLILGRFQREKTIAFTTPSGEVTIALSAIEDLIKHFVVIIPEIKELKPDVIATKKGSIVVNLRVTLKSEANLPELTSRLQEITKSKIQEVLGIDEQIIIRIHISKIISREERERKRKDTDREEPSIPFGGFGRV